VGREAPLFEKVFTEEGLHRGGGGGALRDPVVKEGYACIGTWGKETVFPVQPRKREGNPLPSRFIRRLLDFRGRGGGSSHREWAQKKGEGRGEKEVLLCPMGKKRPQVQRRRIALWQEGETHSLQRSNF